MKKKIVAFLAGLLVVVTVTPVLASFETDASYPAIGEFKLKDVKKFDTALPKNGVKKTQKQIDALLKKIPYPWPSRGNNTIYSYSLFFTRKVKGKYTTAKAYRNWHSYINLIEYGNHYRETKNLIKPAGIDCELFLEGATYNTYKWKKGAAQGSKSFVYDNSYFLRGSQYKLYKDAIIAKQKCIVYSLYSSSKKCTYYIYRSRTTGQLLKILEVYDSGVVNCDVVLNTKYMQKPKSFYKPPVNVKFKVGR